MHIKYIKIALFLGAKVRLYQRLFAAGHKDYYECPKGDKEKNIVPREIKKIQPIIPNTIITSCDARAFHSRDVQE